MPLVSLRGPWLVALAIVLSATLVATASDARPATRSTGSSKVTPAARAAAKKATDPTKRGAVARVKIGREQRPLRPVGRSTEALTLEEQTATQLEKILRGPLLRNGVTALYVANAKTGEPLFEVNANDPLNPASNVKLISTATALELLGPEFRYPTRVLGQRPAQRVVKGDIYLLGSYDPTLSLADFHGLAGALAARGIERIEGNVVVGTNPTRDGIYRAVIPIEIVAGAPGEPPLVNLPPGFDLVEIRMTAKTAKVAMRPRLTYKSELATTPGGQPRIVLTIGGTIGKDGKVDYPLWTKQRTATAAYALIAALHARQITVGGELKVRELGDFMGEAVATGTLPVELARHESRPLSEIVQRINKWSINWLADRVVMTAAALVRREAPTMELALDAMYRWMSRHTKLPRQSIVLDTGSGLSYRTEISARALVSVIRGAGGFQTNDTDVARAWRHSLAIAGRDGTLKHRFRASSLGGRVIGKTGTLSTVIALSGILDVDPQRPLAFALVTNTDTPLSKRLVRSAHEQVIREISAYVEKTAARIVAPQPSDEAAPELPEETEPTDAEAELDREAAAD
jgi:serine-type D-Ala-D-Ala carboxypeptidase/endopeptidase (penicillin-binding protein 4)